MNTLLDTFLVGSAVALAAGFFLRKFWPRAKKKSCGGGCGCSVAPAMKPGAARH